MVDNVCVAVVNSVEGNIDDAPLHGRFQSWSLLVPQGCVQGAMEIGRAVVRSGAGLLQANSHLKAQESQISCTEFAMPHMS